MLTPFLSLCVLSQNSFLHGRKKIKTGFIEFTLIKFTIFNEACKQLGKNNEKNLLYREKRVWLRN